MQLIQVLDIAMALLLAGVAIQFTIQQRTAQSRRLASSPIPQVQVSR
jgi:hypothetical protein